MASFGKQSPWAPRRGQPGQNSMYSNYSSNAPVTYPIGYIQEHHSSGSSGGAKTRSFTGIVTKMSDNHGFIDKDVYFHVSACESMFPTVGDRVMVEAIYNPNNPYKWTSTRVKVLEDRSLLHKRERSPIRGRDHFDRRNEEIDRKRRKIDDRSRDRHDKEKIHRERERERERLREKDKLKEKEHERQQVSPRRRSRSPLRARRPLRYIVKVPNDLLTLSEYDVTLMKKRFRFYIPSDFFNASVVWTELFPPDRPYSLEKPCAFHVMHKDCDSVVENNAVYEPADADYVYSTQVMLVSFPTMEEIYQKCITLTEDEEKANDKLVHISKLIQFLVRSRKNEPASIGGPWSPSLDGPNPDKDPSVLIKTAIRTCKALTGIDLSNCTQWYRVLEVNYHRSESVYKGKAIPARIETVIYFLPEVWTCAPTQLEWENLVSNYGKLLEVKLNPIHEVKETSSEEAKPNSNPVLQSQNQTAQKDEVETDDKDEELIVIDKCEPTHYSKLDPKNMKVSELRQELEARNLSPKGLKPQLMARLQKALKSEEEKEQEEQQEERKPEVESTEKTDDSTTEDSSTKEVVEEEKPVVKEETVQQAMSESERANWTKRYTLPTTPHIIVHPSKTAKSGKFECMVVSLSSLLDYHSDFMREDIFEVRLFAELFNDMLTRDFGYEIFKALYRAPEKPKEEKEEKDKKENEEKKEKIIEKKEEQKDEADNKVKENDSAEVMEIEVKEDTYITVDEDKTGEIKLEAEDGELTKEEEKTEEENKGQPNGTEKEDAVVEKTIKEGVKKKKPVKYYTKDKYLLLSFAFFDHSNCGYIFEKDLETLFQCIGLFFSRSQIKKIINKVSIRDTVHYRKLTDKPKEDDEDQEEEITIKLEDDEIPVQITLNKKLLQSMVDGESGDSPKRSTRKSKSNDAQTKTISGGLVQFNGALVDVEKLLSSIKRSESARLEMENVIQSLKQENETLKENAKRSSEKAKNTSADLNTCREKLMSSNKEVITLKGKLRTHLKVFQTIKENVDPIIESNEKSTTDKAKEKPTETDAANSDDKDKLPNSNDAGEPSVEKEANEAASDQNADNQVAN